MASPGPFNMVAQQHLRLYDALRDHTVRNAATLQAAITAIGSTPTVLVWTFDGDGVWTIDTNLTFPSNITHWVPPGVVASVAAGITLTIQGEVFAFYADWLQGSGTSTLTSAPSHVIGMTGLALRQLIMPRNVVGFTQIALGTADPNVNQISMMTNDDAVFPANGRPIIRFYRPLDPQAAAIQWDMGMDTYHQFFIGWGGQEGKLVINQTGVGIGAGGPPSTGFIAPTHKLHMFVDDAFKATANWSVPSSRQVKTEEEPYTDGLEKVLAWPQPVWCRYNGQGGTPADGERVVSVMADDVQDLAPYMVSTYRAKLRPEDPEETDLQAMNTSPLVYMLINAIKEQQAQLEALRAEVQALRAPGGAEDAAPPPRRGHGRRGH